MHKYCSQLRLEEEVDVKEALIQRLRAAVKDVERARRDADRRYGEQVRYAAEQGSGRAEYSPSDIRNRALRRRGDPKPSRSGIYALPSPPRSKS